MAMQNRKTVPKISVKIWQPTIEKFDAKIEAACLRRDAYLSKVLDVELDWLDAEVSISNSQASYDYVARRLDQLDRKLVSLALPLELTARLNEICERKRIVRDAFFNRLFLLLAASPKLIDFLLFRNSDYEDWRYEVWSEHRNDGPFFQNSFYPLEPEIDPFWAIRTGMQLFSKTQDAEPYVEPTSGKTVQVIRDVTGAPEPVNSIYTMVFDLPTDKLDLLGLSCYMPDRRIPGHDTEQQRRSKLDDLLINLEGQS